MDGEGCPLDVAGWRGEPASQWQASRKRNRGWQDRDNRTERDPISLLRLLWVSSSLVGHLLQKLILQLILNKKSWTDGWEGYKSLTLSTSAGNCNSCIHLKPHPECVFGVWLLSMVLKTLPAPLTGVWVTSAVGRTQSYVCVCVHVSHARQRVCD